MRFIILSSILAQVLLLASSVSAFPAKSGACTVDVDSKLQGNGIKGMSPMAAGNPSSYSFTMDKKSYQPGDKIKIKMNGPNFRGILMYFSPADDSKKRVGKFVAPKNFQGLGTDCNNKNFPSDDALSVLTHSTISGAYKGMQSFTFNAPTGGVTSDLNLNVLVVQKSASGGFTSYVYKDVAILKGSTGSGTGLNNKSPIKDSYAPPSYSPPAPVYKAPPMYSPAPPMHKNNPMEEETVKSPVMEGGACPPPATVTTTCTVTKTVQKPRTTEVTVTVTEVATKTQIRKCTRKAMVTPGLDSPATPTTGPSNGNIDFEKMRGPGSPGPNFTGKFFTMTCTNTVPPAKTDTPALCLESKGAAPAIKAFIKASKKGSLWQGMLRRILANSRTMPAIPIVDLSPLFGTSQTDRSSTQRAILDALTGPGFMYIKGHGVPQETIDAVFAKSDDFFKQDLHHKTRLAYNPSTNTGYVGLNRERLNPNLPQNDNKEAFNINPQSIDPTALPPQFASTPVLTEFCMSVHKTLLAILQAISSALAIPASDGGDQYLPLRHPFNAPSGTILRLLCYPPAPLQTDQQDRIRAGAHTDYGSLTALFLRPTDTDGLQVLNSSTNTFQEAPPIPGTIVINAGDLLQFWTDGVVKSTVHRVVERRGGDGPRLSVAYFLHPEDGVLLERIPGEEIRRRIEGTGKGEEGRVGEGGVWAGPSSGGKAITARDHLMERLKRSYG
ncbi:hypothetical protein HDU97_005555 [Phlyctochytrium planicorne]|nr:hypothetical protein HDU97_005555 [Phlyctochytrium planicorne]